MHGFLHFSWMTSTSAMSSSGSSSSAAPTHSSTCRTVVVPMITLPLPLHGRAMLHAIASSVGVIPHRSASSTHSRVAAIACAQPYLG